MATKMSAKMESVFKDIKWEVENARAKTYEEWLGPLKDCGFYWTRYNEAKLGFAHGYWDRRTLNALAKRGLIQFADDNLTEGLVARLVEE